MNDFDDAEFYEIIKSLNMRLGVKALDKDVVMNETSGEIQVVEDVVMDETHNEIQIGGARDKTELPDYLVALRNGNYQGSDVMEISSDSESSDDDVQFLYELVPVQRRKRKTGTQPIATYKEQTNEEASKAYIFYHMSTYISSLVPASIS